MKEGKHQDEHFSNGAVSEPRNPAIHLEDILANKSDPPQVLHEQLLLLHGRLSHSLAQNGQQPEVLFERARTYLGLDYPDLAASDAYLALALAEEALGEGDGDLEPVMRRGSTIVTWPNGNSSTLDCDLADPPDEETARAIAMQMLVDCMRLLQRCLVKLGCWQDAYGYQSQLNSSQEGRGQKTTDLSYLEGLMEDHCKVTDTKMPDLHQSLNASLPNSGFARREVYPWNTHEPDRSATAALEELNSRLRLSAPNLEVKSTTLPILQSSFLPPNSPKTTTQLGLFATAPLAPSSPILRERSTVTAIRDISASLCETCASPLPSLTSPLRPIPCTTCHSAIFCSPACHDLAQSLYHPTLCKLANLDDLDALGCSPSSTTPSEDLYFLLLTRVIAMSLHQRTHPLDLPEVKYLCGDFVPHASTPRLPFTFQHSIVLPHQYLTTLALSRPEIISENLLFTHFAPWVLSTLYAKFRGVASARQSTWDGRPEVAVSLAPTHIYLRQQLESKSLTLTHQAIHPLWSLANHSCSPNVGWSWGEDSGDAERVFAAAVETEEEEEERLEREGGEVIYRVRAGPVWTRPNAGSGESAEVHNGENGETWRGIKQGEEILNHYCDIRLPVAERRAWARGALGGGDCSCERCVWEAGEEEEGADGDDERGAGGG